MFQNSNTAYVTGVAIGDGNLSNPTGTAVRLRISCDNKYPFLQHRIVSSIQILFPQNKVSNIYRKRNCTDISCYSNQWEELLGWKALDGSKEKQNIRVPNWIFYNKEWVRNCLKGLFETDGSIYLDRKYLYANFTTILHGLALDVHLMIHSLGYRSRIQYTKQKNGKWKFTVRVSKRSKEFINEIGIEKR